MDWDMNIDEDFGADPRTTLPQEREIAPAGRHLANIKKAEEGPNKWKTDEKTNPDGICLKLRLAIGDYRFVFHDLPKHQPWMAKQLADALGIQPEGNTLRVVPAEIEGRDVEVEISHYTAKSGKVSAVVKRYLPPLDKPASKPAAKKNTTQKITAALPNDDIPFLWLAGLVASVIGGLA
jgi:hypothetical protein